MNVTKTSNPILNEAAFKKDFASDGKMMTLQGTMNKTLALFGLLIVSAAFTWKLTLAGTLGLNILLPATIIAFILAIVTNFAKKYAAITSPIYAICEGVVLGSISSVFEAAYSGIVFQAVMLTLIVFGLMLFMYKTGVLKATGKFKKGVFIATIAIGVYYLIAFIASFFTSANFMGGGLLGIIISLIIVAVAALNLILDFDFIEQSVSYGSPKYMEWYAGFGLMVTLVWLYIEILRLLSYLRND